MTTSTRWLTVIALVGLVAGGWLAWAPPAAAQAVAVCDPATTCFDVTLPSGLVGDVYLGDTLAAPGVNSARLTGAPATPFVISVHNLQEPGVAGFGDLYVYPDQSQANQQGLAGQVRFIRFTPVKNYVKGSLSYTCNPRGAKAGDSVACRPAIDGAVMPDLAPGAVTTYNLTPGAHAVHTDLVGDSANNWSAVARDDSVTVSAGTAMLQTTRLSADFILKGLLQLGLYPANLLADWYLDGVQVATQVNVFNVYVAASVNHVVEAKKVQEPGAAGFGDVYNYPDQSQPQVIAGAAQTRGVAIRPLKSYFKGALNYICNPSGFKATDSVACRPTLDGTPMTDVAPGATVVYNLTPGAHTVHTDLVGDSANNWSAAARDDSVTINAGTAMLQTTRLSADFILKGLLQLSLYPANLVADWYVDGVQVAPQVNAFNLYVAASVAHVVEAKNIQEPGAAGFGDVYNYLDQSQPNTLAGPAQIRGVAFRPLKNYLKGALNYICNPSGFKATDSVACRPTLDGTPMTDVAPGATVIYNLPPGAHTVHTDLVGDSANNWSAVARDDSVTINAGTALLQTTRLSADFILKGLLQLSLYPANLVADWYVDGVQAAPQVNAFNLYVAASVAHVVEAKNIQEPGAVGFGDVYNYPDQSQTNTLAGPAQIRGVVFRPLKNYLKGALSFVCDPRGFKATDSVACRPTLDAAPMTDVVPGATVIYNLPPGAHTVHTDLVGDSANNWGPILRDDVPVVNAGTSFLQTTILRSTFQLKALLKLTLNPQGLVADFFVNDAQVGTQVPAAEVYVPAGTYTVVAKNVADPAANGVYRYDDAPVSATVFASQVRPIALYPKKVFLQGYLNVTCRINGLLPGDEVRCNVSADGQPMGPVESGQTQKFTLATGTHALNVRLSGKNAALWAPISVDQSVNVIGGGLSALSLVFDARGRQLMAQGQYQEAMALYLNVKATSQDPEVLAGADLGYQEALAALASASTGQGATVVQNALTTACAGQPAGSPAINLFKDQPGKGLVCNNAFALPSDLAATIPGTFRYVVVKETGTNEVEHCSYTNNHTLVRVDNWLKLKLISTETGQVVNENTVWGSTAPGCPDRRMFYSLTEYSYGGNPSLEDAFGWLRGVH